MDKLFHIEWGDDDNSFVLAQDDVEAREKMGDIRDMIRTVCELPSVFQEIFELGKGAERERIMGVIESLNSIGHPYGGNYKEAVLKALKEE